MQFYVDLKSSKNIAFNSIKTRIKIRINTRIGEFKWLI